jgi:hypothetical protein
MIYSKEKEMTDIKSALSNVLNEWDKHEETIRTPQPQEKQTMTTKLIAHRFKPTNNASRETFNAVRDFPNQKGVFYIEMLGKKGFKSSTVSTLLYQMARNGQIAKAKDGCLVTTSSAYSPVKTLKKVKDVVPDKKLVRELIANVDKPSVGIAALNAEPTPAPRKTSLILNRDWTPYKAIENLNVFQARALYDELKKMFGE